MFGIRFPRYPKLFRSRAGAARGRVDLPAARGRAWAVWLAALAVGVLVLAGGMSVWIWGRQTDPVGAPRSGPQVEDLNYDCGDAATVAAIRALPRPGFADLWVGDVGLSLPADALGHDVPFLLGSSRLVKMPIFVRQGVQFLTITMEGVDLRTGDHLAFDYGGMGFSAGTVTYQPAQTNRPLFGSLSAPKPGIYRLTFALDGVNQGSTILALCRSASA